MTDPSKFEICVVIPARNEALAIAGVIGAIPSWVSKIIVVDNGSSDGTAKIAEQAGATVINEPVPGYGRACLAGIEEASACDIIVFMDGDGADIPAEMTSLVKPILLDHADLVIGSRALGTCEAGALTFPQQFGNAFACALMRIFWQAHYTDLGPFRAIRRETLNALAMTAPTYGWTVEMQARIAKRRIKFTEIPVSYKRRIGTSKISGTIKGTILAGVYIIGTIMREAITNSTD